MNLASHITHWPEAATHAVVDGGVIAFTKGGAPVWSNEEWTILGGAGASVRWVQISGAKMSKEWCAEKHIVTRAQWEAERARIAGINEQYTFHPGEAIMPSPFDLPRYEQELWDKVAASVAPAVYADAMSEFSKTGCPCEDWRDYVASDICNMADAFMAERAKRLKQ